MSDNAAETEGGPEPGKSVSFQQDAIELQGPPEQKADGESEEAEEYRRDYEFISRKQLRSQEEDLLLASELTQRRLEYHQHEFVKMNEVGVLITEAVQTVLDKLQSKEVQIRQNKSNIRNMDGKLKQIEGQVLGLLKLGNDFKKMDKKQGRLDDDLVCYKKQVEERLEEVHKRFQEHEHQFTQVYAFKESH